MHGRPASCMQDFLMSPDRGGESYSSSKLANVLFTYEAQRRLAPLGIQVGCVPLVSCHPVRPRSLNSYAHQCDDVALSGALNSASVPSDCKDSPTHAG